MPTVKEILRDKPLGETEDVSKILPFAEGGESEGEVGEEEEGELEAAVEEETS